jgi:hypothetical protein
MPAGVGYKKGKSAAKPYSKNMSKPKSTKNAPAKKVKK